MDGDAITLMEKLDGPCGDPRPKRLAQQRMRYRIIVTNDLDMIVETRSALLPFGVNVRRCWERLQGRSVCRVEQGAPARAQMPRYAVVECYEALPDRRVQLRQREEPPVPELGDDPSCRDLHGHFNLGLVARLPGPRRHDRHAVVRRHPGIAAIDG